MPPKRSYKPRRFRKRGPRGPYKATKQKADRHTTIILVSKINLFTSAKIKNIL